MLNCSFNYNEPLSAHESAFAAEHHYLIGQYLNAASLSHDDFYDIAVFGYLRAVRKYLARPELRQYAFSTIAYRAMSCDVHHSREYWQRAKRRRCTLTLDDDQDTDDLRELVSEAVSDELFLEHYLQKLTPIQRRIALLRCNG